MKTARWIILVLALIIGLSACARTPPVVTPTIPVQALTPEQIRLWWYSLSPQERQFLYALDVALNQILPHLPGGAVPGMTISERAARAARAGDPRGQFICMFLDLADPGHCERAIRE